MGIVVSNTRSEIASKLAYVIEKKIKAGELDKDYGSFVPNWKAMVRRLVEDEK